VTTGQPANNNTLTVDGLAYTFKTAINNANPREVLIGASWQETLQALVHAINDDGVGEGTSYSSATTAHPTCTASYHASNGWVYVSSIATGPGVTGIPISESMANSSIGGQQTGRLYLGGYRLTSATSPEGHKMCVDLRENGAAVKTFFGNAYALPGPGASAEYDGTRWTAEQSNYWTILPATGRYFRVIASRYSVWVCVPGSTAQSTAFGATLVKVPDARMAPGTITAASGGGGDSVVVTQPAHGMEVTGNVYISGAQGLAIDGFWNLTVLDVDTYSLDGSASLPAGEYIAGSARAADLNRAQISQAFFAWSGNAGYGGTAGLRNNLAGADCRIGRVNQYGWASTGSSAGDWAVYAQTALQWFDARYWIQEAPVFMGQDVTGARFGVGWLWGAFLLAKRIPGDTVATDSQGQKWFAYTMQAASDYTLMLAVPPAEN
jgi:hypothetical protein